MSAALPTLNLDTLMSSANVVGDPQQSALASQIKIAEPAADYGLLNLSSGGPSSNQQMNKNVLMRQALLQVINPKQPTKSELMHMAEKARADMEQIAKWTADIPNLKVSDEIAALLDPKALRKNPRRCTTLNDAGLPPANCVLPGQTYTSPTTGETYTSWAKKGKKRRRATAWQKTKTS